MTRYSHAEYVNAGPDREGPPPIYNRQDAERRHRGYWFTPDTLRFFGSRIGECFYMGRGRSFFVSSERTGFDHYSPRAYTVRAISWESGDILREEDYGCAFNQYASHSGAHAAARRLALADAAGELGPWTGDDEATR